MDGWMLVCCLVFVDQLLVGWELSRVVLLRSSLILCSVPCSV